MQKKSGYKHTHTHYRSGDPMMIGWYATRQKLRFGKPNTKVRDRLVRRFWDGSGVWSIPITAGEVTSEEAIGALLIKDTTFGLPDRIEFSGLRNA